MVGKLMTNEHPLSMELSSAAADNQPVSSLVSITVLSVSSVKTGKLFALAAVEIDIDGVRIEIHGIRAVRTSPVGTRIELPTYRDPNGIQRPTIVLPDEVREPIADAVLDALIERGIAKRRFAVTEDFLNP